MDGLTLLRQARAAGLAVRADGERLTVRGPRSWAGLAEALLAQKAEIVALLTEEEAPVPPPPAPTSRYSADDPEVAWRVQAMCERLKTAGVGLLFLTVREVLRRHPGCMSCGLALGLEERVRCGYCARAARIVTDKYAAGAATS